MISVIIPTLNEERYLPKLLHSLKPLQPEEIIVVDGGSGDKTVEVARSLGAKVLFSERGRGLQLHRGALEAKGNYLLFLHADTYFPEPIDLSNIAKQGIQASFFTLCYEEGTPSLRLLAKLINLRSRLWNLPYGDQGLFLERELYFQVGGFKELPFLEDLEFILRLRKIYRPVPLSYRIIVSGRKLKSNLPLYPFLVSLRNNFLILLYLLGFSPYTLRKLYK